MESPQEYKRGVTVRKGSLMWEEKEGPVPLTAAAPTTEFLYNSFNSSHNKFL